MMLYKTLYKTLVIALLAAPSSRRPQQLQTMLMM
jgi:hypothetical protein